MCLPSRCLQDESELHQALPEDSSYVRQTLKSRDRL